MIPIRNNVLVKPFAADEISLRGIIVPESARKDSNKVYVVKVGNGTKDKPMRLKEGMVGFRIKECGVDIIIKGEKHFLIDDNSIIALND